MVPNSRTDSDRKSTGPTPSVLSSTSIAARAGPNSASVSRMPANAAPDGLTSGSSEKRPPL